jgi:hypothetical protein
MRRSAAFDATGRYRYGLVRTWARGRRVAFVMLNPSTADAARDDPTIRRCVGFARAWGFGSLEVVNLFALRTPQPRDLVGAADPVGPENGRHVARALGRADLVVAAWGGAALARASDPLGRYAGVATLRCLGRTRSGAPRHPLYLRASTRLVPFGGSPGRIDRPERITQAARLIARGSRRRHPRS